MILPPEIVIFEELVIAYDAPDTDVAEIEPPRIWLLLSLLAIAVADSFATATMVPPEIVVALD